MNKIQKITIGLFLISLIFISITNSYSQEKKKIKPKQIEKESILQEQEKSLTSEENLSQKTAQKAEYRTEDIVKDTQRTLDRSISTLNTVVGLIGILVVLISLVITIAAATGIFQYRKWAAIKKAIEEDVRYIKELRDKGEEELDNLRKGIENVRIPSFTEEWPSETKQIFSNFGRKIDNYEMLGLSLKPEDYINRGLGFLSEEKYIIALEGFEKAIELEPDEAKAWLYKGKSLSGLKRYEEALKTFEKTLALKPDLHDAWHDKGCALIDLKRYEEALKTFEKAVELKPYVFESLYGKGLSLYELSRYDEALDSFNKAIDLNPDFASSWYYRASIYSIKGNKEMALSDLSKSIELDVENKKEAKEDEDFKNLWEDLDFKKITS